MKQSLQSRLADGRWFLSQLKRRLSGQRYFGLNGLDAALEKYVDFDNGFFVEAGANDGATQSNTLHFERFRGWRGLLVEPIPDLARRCRMIRRHSIVENVALGSFDQRGTSVDMTYVNLMSIADGALPTEDDQNKHVQGGSNAQQLQPYRLTVPCVPLSDLLDKHGVTKIDFLSLDVEGYEPQALSGLDFSRHRPRFILIEADRYRDRVEQVIFPHYRVATQLTPGDVLYESV